VPGHATGHPALRRLVADPEAFARDVWGTSALLTPADGRTFADLFDVAAVDELVSQRGLRTPFIRVAKDGNVVASARYTRPGGVGAMVGDQVADDRILELFLDGHTVVLQGLHRVWPPIIDFAGALTTDLGHPVQVNAYITPRSSTGFSAHYDVHDVFVLQVAGRKHWTVHAPVHADPLRDQPWNDRADAVAARARDDEPALDTVLEPGDALYLPRGWLHAATALGGVSAHLTVGVHVVTRYALVEALTALIADDPRLRASLPLGIDVADPAALAPHLDAVREALVVALAAVPAEAVARRVRGRVWSGGRPEPVGPLAAAAFADGLSTGDAVRPRAGLPVRVVEQDGSVVLELPDRTLILPASTLAALRAVVRPGRHAVGSLPGMDQADQLVLVRRLLREGVLVPATGP
jgi:bifunctional lysine-specific demethylase and histidyl-hydroxylase NO66